jgi:hypothetical protein
METTKKTLTGSWKKHLDFRFLAGEDFGDKVVTMTIKNIIKEEAFNTKKNKTETVNVLYFEETTKGIILNVTNARSITQLLKTDLYEQWIGKKIPFWGEPHKVHGRVVRVKQDYSGVKV